MVADVKLLCDVSVDYHADVRVVRSPPTRVVGGRGGVVRNGCEADMRTTAGSASLVKYQSWRSNGMSAEGNDKKPTYRHRTPPPEPGEGPGGCGRG